MKVLLISDIHLRAYHRFNKFPDQRLNSFLDLARDIVKEGKSRGIKVLIITGDIIDKSTLSPKEIHTLFQMFTILAEHFTIYSIVGNHDMKLKKGEFEWEDSIVTLLTEIDNVVFLHQKIIQLGGRTLAFENWMPEFKLDWIKDPVDLYFSHATIDYDQAGFYGMDTSVFEGKFTLGFFGDIHVRRELGNYISVGNTKQESLSDRYQGGGIVLDLDDLSWERFDIDPEHKKYLYLLPTDDKDEEGWVDLEGDDMTYRIYKPKKVEGKNLEFTLPKTTDLESKLNEVMLELGLIDLHNEIKSSVNYQPIDFNFKLNKLVIENFRSIKNYILDFSDDYIINGLNGSGKSSLITALFFALIGKKTLKSDVTRGEKSCKLVLFLTYQNQEFIITRGTDGGDYGLSINKVDQKYNNKLEFEKDVYMHLPFLNYHEAFFFNYWDTELLGSMKLDRRFDLIAKFFRLDALSDYNDVGTTKSKVAKKVLKDLKDSYEKDTILVDSRKADLEILNNELKGKPKLEELLELRESYKKRSEISKEYELQLSNFNQFKSNLDESESTKNKFELAYKEDLNELKNEPSLDQINKSIEVFNSRNLIQSRIDKGTNLVSQIKSEIVNIELQIKNCNSTMALINPGELKDIPESLLDSIDKLKTEISERVIKLSNERLTLDMELSRNKSELEKLKLDAEEVSKVTNCISCGKPMSNEEKLEFLFSAMKSSEEIYKNLIKKDKDLTNETEEFNSKDKLEKESSLDKLLSELSELNAHNKIVKENSAKISDLTNQLSELKVSLDKKNSDKNAYENALTELESELRSLPFISESDNNRNHVLISKYERLEKSKKSYELADSSYKELQRVFNEGSKDLQDRLNSMKKSIDEIPEVDIEDNINAALIIDTYRRRDEAKSLAKDLSKKLDKLEKEIEVAHKNFDDLDSYCQLTSRSGEVLKQTLESLTKTFSNNMFRFTTNKSQASGKVVTDMSVEFLVGKNWFPYPALSSGQKTLCDLYFISKVVTGVGIMSFDETLRFLDDESMKIASDIIVSIKKQNLLISSHSPNLYVEGVTTLNCQLNNNSLTEIQLI